MKSISFSDAMILAILDGRKTVTRRLMKSQPGKHGIQVCTSSPTGYAYNSGIMPNRCSCVPVPCPYRPGETAYVKEAWGFYDWTEDGCPFLQYRADGEVLLNERHPEEWADRLSDIWAELSEESNFRRYGAARDGYFRSSLFMPEWASRLKIRIVSVRAERIQDITEDEAVKEGAEWRDYGLDRYGCFREGWAMDHPRPTEKCLPTARMAFANYWNRLHGGERWNLKPTSAWDRNEWVWRYEFEVTE